MTGHGRRIMDDVRRKNTGTWDRTQNRWELKKLGIRKTPRQLAEVLGEKVPEGKIASRPFWDKYLVALGKADEAEKRKRSRLQERLRSLDIIIESLEAENRDATEFRKERQHVLNLPEWDTDHADIPAVHPDAKTELELLGLQDDELAIRVHNSHHTKRPPQKGSVKKEVEAYIAAKTGKDKHNIAAALNLFLKACGNITVREIDIEVYRRFKAFLMEQTSWGDTTKAKNQGRVHTFLHALETDYNHPMPWIGDKRHMLEVPEGGKVQYDLHQVQAALAHADGIARTVLLAGLNFGFYASDMVELGDEHVVGGGTHVSKVRAKLKHKRNKVKPVWAMWPETKAVLRFGLTKTDIEREFNKLRTKYKLPEQKALRKTVAQMIQDHAELGEEYALLYRGESRAGTHHKNYIRPYTPAQVAKLDRALEIVRGVFFGEGRAINAPAGR
jgi:hypothetical protein